MNYDNRMMPSGWANHQSPYYETIREDDELPSDSSDLSPTEILKPSCPLASVISRALPEDLFRKALAKFLPHPKDPLLDKKILVDSVFPAISQLLVDYDKYEWSLRPRTFALLWMLGIPEKMDTFVAEGTTDHYLPYNEGNLPDIIKGTMQRSTFLTLQNVVRCRREEDLSGLEEGGRHIHLPGQADAYFHSLQILGSGRFAQVDKVFSRRTLKTYARKQIHRGQSVLDDKLRLSAFEKELRSLKAISHRHVVKVVGSYTDSTTLGILMRPVAETDLHQYLNSTQVDPALRKRSLRSFFGCLVTALAYVHRKNIRHKDIKPSNVLVEGGSILLADFGTSRICLDGHLTTKGESKEGTPRYWGPEVIDGADRNTASDIWSLGCVFLEMATTIFGYTHADMLQFYQQHGTEHAHRICLNVPATRLWIEKMRSSADPFDRPVLDWTSWMLQEKPEDRPTAAQLRSKILDTRTEYDYICHHCASSNGIDQSDSPASGTMLTPKKSEGTSSLSRKQSHEAGHHVDSHAVVDRRELCEAPKSLTTPDSSLVKPREVAKRKVNFATVSYSIDTRGDTQTARTKNPQSGRFTGLPESQRPDLTPFSAVNEPDDFEVDGTDGFIVPDPIKPPPFYARDCLPLPTASFTPSYVLAGTNHLSMDEVEHMLTSRRARNLFVYGRLMFPSLLHIIAAQSTKGVYSPNLQRRLVLGSDDWSGINLSISRATELMTPAFLPGFSRWQPEKIPGCSVMQKSVQYDGHHSNEGVAGFLITGLSPDAVHYLDLLLTSKLHNLQTLTTSSTEDDFSESDSSDSEDDFARRRPRSKLSRQVVHVRIEPSNGPVTTVPADSYVWRSDPYGADEYALISKLATLHPWNADEFVRGYVFQDMLEDHSSARAEEYGIATKMKMVYPYLGDGLCHTILADNIRGLQQLLQDRWSPNTPCRGYGSPLQAAVTMGNEDMVELLVRYGADANYRGLNGGRYGTPLIAAAVASRKAIARLLLRRGANVFGTHPVHVNALYQAVGHSDYAMAEMLLEHAAWLTEEWFEVCDLAAETGDREIISLLARYDVRELHRTHVTARRKPRESYRDSKVPTSSLNIVGTVVRKSLAVQGMSGNWKGRKGVAVMVAALNAGASLDTIRRMRQTVGPLKALLDALKERDESEDGRFRVSWGDGGAIPHLGARPEDMLMSTWLERGLMGRV